MKKNKNIHGDEDLSGNLKRVSGLIDALMDEDLNPNLRAEMQAWFNSAASDAEKQEAFVRYSEKIRPCEDAPDSETVRLYNEIAADLGLRQRSVPAPVVKLRRRSMILRRVAAVLIPALIVTGTLLLFTGREGNAPAVNYVRVSPASGSPYVVELPDGSTVRLSDNAELAYAENFIGNRSVELTGDAYFTVGKMEGAPFTVKTPDLTVTVLGTEFMLKSGQDGQTEVSLLSGSIEVSTGDTTVVLTPGRQLVQERGTHKTQIHEFDITKINRGLRTLTLGRVTIREAAEKISGFLGFPITVEDGVPDTELVLPEISDTDTPEDIVFLFDLVSTGTECKREGNGAVIRVRGK